MCRYIFFSVLFSLCFFCNSYGADKGKKLSPDDIYARGMHFFSTGNYESAYKKFDELNLKYPFSKYSKSAALKSIISHYKSGDFEETIAEIDRYIQLYSTGDGMDYVYYLKGMVLFNSKMSFLQKMVGVDHSKYDVSDLYMSMAAFRMVIDNYKNSKYFSESRVRVDYIRNLLARHELRIAKFYFDRENYSAALSRAKKIVEKFQGSQYVVDALILMERSYVELNNSSKAKIVRNILHKNYPWYSREVKNI